MKIITFNIRNHSDRWNERCPLVVKTLLREQADLIAFQEVSLQLGAKNQAELIAEALNNALGNEYYSVYFTEGRGFQKGLEGIAILSHWPVLENEKIALPNKWRVAQRLRVQIDRSQIMLYNTHLHHLPIHSERIRFAQAKSLIKWTQSSKIPFIVVGDMNAIPGSKTIELFTSHLTSTFAEFHGQEPEITWPTPLLEMLPPGEVAGTLDYIFLSKDDFKIQDCRLIGDEPEPDDPSLYPSDHFGIYTEIVLN